MEKKEENIDINTKEAVVSNNTNAEKEVIEEENDKLTNKDKIKSLITNDEIAKEAIKELISDISEEKKQKEKLSFKENLKSFFSIGDDVADHDTIKDRIVSGGKITGTNASILVFAIIIACVGLNTNSIPVIIGAMLISPLMGTIMAISYGVVSADFKYTIKASLGFLFQFIVSFIIAVLFFLISPVKDVTQELLNRTNPSVFDIIIATCGGAAGMIAQTRNDKVSNVIPGVAIATALMPPICTMGFSLANGQWSMLLKSSYLFLINFYFIFLSAAIVLSLLRIPKVKELSPKQWKRIKFKMIRNTIIIALPAIAVSILLGMGII